MIKKVLLFLVIAGLFTGCVSAPTAVLTPTLAPATNTPVPTQTPAPTGTPEPSPAPTVQVVMGSKYLVNGGGFSFNSVEGMFPRLNPPSATLSDMTSNVFFSMATQDVKEEKSAALFLEDFLNSVAMDINDLETSESYPIMVGGQEGYAADLSGTMSGKPFEGQAVMVVVKPGRVFYASAVGMVDGAANHWQVEGHPMFAAVLNSIEFYEPQVGGNLCPVSDDPTYGKTKENPIQVGGDYMEGPWRQRAYMDVLRGPNGEEINYTRTGSEEVGETILDVYELTYGGNPEPVTLYVDEYHFNELFAPVGFTCASPIPLSAP